jgi:hypothetical protein
VFGLSAAMQTIAKTQIRRPLGRITQGEQVFVRQSCLRVEIALKLFFVNGLRSVVSVGLKNRAARICVFISKQFAMDGALFWDPSLATEEN